MPAPARFPPSLCTTCQHVREVVSGTGSTFLLCRLSQTDKRFAKYPPQPIVRCLGYQASAPEVHDSRG